MKPAIFSSLQYKACNKQMSTPPILDLRDFLIENNLRCYLFTSEKLDAIIVSFEGSNFVIHSINRIVFYGNRDYFVAVESL